MRAVINNKICWASCVLAFFGLFGSLEASTLQCVPHPSTPALDDAMGVTVCENSVVVGQNLSGITQLPYPSDGQFSHKKPFQIRSCGKYHCDRAAYFNVRSDGVTLKDNQDNPTSEIPLTVSIKQLSSGKIVNFPADTECLSGLCDFQGAGRVLYQCEECLNFELTMRADFNDLIRKGTLKQSGKHSGTLTFIIDQAGSTADSGVPDASVNWPVNLYIELDIPSLIQISGLEDMTLSSEGTGTQRFCVYTLGAPTFSLMPVSKNGEPYLQGSQWSDFRLSNEAEDYLRYSMDIDDGAKSFSYNWGSRNDYLPPVYTGWKPSNVLDCSAGENMELTISLIDNMNAVPDGVYSDTMEITVYPE